MKRERVLRHGKDRILGLILTALLVFSGAGFEEIRIDSSYVCAASENMDSGLCSCGIHQVGQACTPGIYSDTECQKAICGNANPKREIKLSPVFAYSGFIFSLRESVSQSVFLTQEEGVGLRERVTEFIHSSDGKKRRAT